jgi:hypothetical protein
LVVVVVVVEQGVCPPEIRGNRIFAELVSRSFFQETKNDPIDHDLFIGLLFRYCSRVTCKIHDLMHDVAQSAMEKEYATITDKPSTSEDLPYSSPLSLSKSGDLPYSTRHLFVSCEDPKAVLKGFLEKSSLNLQTLLCTTGYTDEVLQFLSKYNSIRALCIKAKVSFLKPKYLHHLKYLDLSYSDIVALPEDISILCHLQTLKLSGCDRLVKLPKEMKYMTALHHLYTDGCSQLKMMPPELRCLASLITLTCFVAGTTDSSCSNVGELQLLNLGDQLEVRQLENVTESDAQTANLENKKRLDKLRLAWSYGSSKEPQHHHKVLEGLKLHNGIKALCIINYGGSTYPTWINTLQHMVELVLFDCNKLEKLPPLWRLPALQVVRIDGMKNLRCFCDGDPPFTFNKLKFLTLERMPILETWWDINATQGQDNIFSEVEELRIVGCKKLTALPRAPAITESLGGVNTVFRSAFPALKALYLQNLASFQRWDGVEGTPTEKTTTFPWVDDLSIINCPELTTLPEAPKLNVLQIDGCSQKIFLHAARYITSVSTLDLSIIVDGGTPLPTDHSLIKLVDDKEKWRHESPAPRIMYLDGCEFWFQSSAPAAIWNCFVQLEELRIESCHFVHWPENVFRGLVSLRGLVMLKCKKLTGRTQQDSTTPGQSVFLPRLETLVLKDCDSFVEVPTLPASLRKLVINGCEKLEYVIVRKEQNITRDGVVIRSASCSEPMSSSNLSLKELNIWQCHNIQSLSVQLDVTKLDISWCGRLKSLNDLPSLQLEHLELWDCKSLESIPDGPQAYSSLRYLSIEDCPHLKELPRCLKHRLNDIEHPDLDDCYTGN